MPDDPNTTQNPISEENSTPPSPQEPIPDVPIPPPDSAPAEVPPEVSESSPDVLIPESQNTPTPLDTGDTQITEMGNELSAEPEAETEPQHPVREILAKAQEAIQNKKRKKLDRILTLFATKSEITNDEVEKLLHVSDATATRYLSILEDEGKIVQNGRTGRSVSYSKI
jgi:hypothetical protein